MSLVFYDTETTGLEAAFDQILQFAAVRVEHNLDVIETFERGCQLLPHIVPSPQAMRVNRMTPARLTDPSFPTHYAMMRDIQAKLLAWSPSLFMGYNSLEFDEHMLRHALYRTLHPAYLTNTNQNTRSDVLRMARATALFAPGVLLVPFRPDGGDAFDLASLAQANNFRAERSHTAANDVQATLHLARLIMDGAPGLWSSFMRFAQKSAVLDHVRQEPIFSLTDFHFGKPYSWLVTTIGTSATNPGELIIYDLSVDPADLAMLDGEELLARMQTQPKPLRRLRANASPVIMPVEDAPVIAAARWLGQEELERRVKRVREDLTLASRLIATFEALRKPSITSPYVEARLYGGVFTPDTDLPILAAFHAAPWNQRAAILEHLSDVRLRELGAELIFLEAPEVLSAQQRAFHQAAHSGRLLSNEADVPWTTLSNAIEMIDMIVEDCPDDEKAFLIEHRGLLSYRLAQLASLAA